MSSNPVIIRMREGSFKLTRFYGIFLCGSLQRTSKSVNAPFRHFSRRDCSATGSCVRAIPRGHFPVYTALFLVGCWVFFALSGCGGAAIEGTSAQAGFLSVSTSPVTFGSVVVGQVESSTVSLSNTGPVAVQVTQVNVTGQPFALSDATNLPVSIPSHGTYNMSVTFSPQATGAASGQLTITSNALSNGTATIGLSGTGMILPPPIALTALSCTDSSVTGAGTDQCTVALGAAAASGGFAVTVVSSNNAVTVPATVTVPEGADSVNFAATVSSSSSTQTVTLTASGGGATETFPLQLNAPVQGSPSEPSLTVSADTLTFGNLTLNTAATQSLTLTSNGSTAVSVSSATVEGAGFSLPESAFPLSLNSGQTATLDVQFDPTVTGPATGTLTVVSTSSASPTIVISLSGTGVAGSSSGSDEVDLSWQAPSSSPDPVAGFNVYRSPSGASAYQQLNSDVLTGTTYTDSTVQAGQSYDYIVKSVDASGAESAPSNTATAAIP